MSQTKKAFINGNIYTVDPKKPYAEAILVQDKTIIKVDTTIKILNLVDNETEVIDLKQKLVLPGFIDAHTHLFLGAILSFGIQFDFFTTKENVLETVKKYNDENPDIDYIIGIGFPTSIFGDKLPLAIELDAIVNDKPVVLLDEGCHSMWVNSKALQIANINKYTPDPIPGGDFYHRDSDNNPTGWIIESLSMRPIIAKLNLLQNTLKKDLTKHFDFFASYGITALYNATEFFFGNNDLSSVEYMDQRAKEGKATLRFVTSYSYNNHDNTTDAIDLLVELNKKYYSDYVRFDTLKIWLDGTVEARNAALTEPYLDTQKTATVFFPKEELKQAITKATKNNLSVHMHCIGDKTINIALKICKKAQTPDYTGTHTIAHNTIFNQDTLDLYTNSNVIANTTPMWHVASEDAKVSLGEKRYNKYLYLFNSLIKRGVLTTFGSDYPTGEGKLAMDIFFNLQCGRTRTYLNATTSLAPKEECLSIEDMIKGYTINAAKQINMDNKIGSIEEGKFADFVVIRENIFEQKDDQLHNNKVIMTIFDGKIIYKDTNF